MQTYDATQLGSIKRSESYLRKKERAVKEKRCIRDDLAFTVVIVLATAIAFTTLVAAIYA